MRIKNSTSLDDKMVRDCLTFAAQGVRDVGVEVWVVKGFRGGRMWGDASSIYVHDLPLKTAKTTKYLIRIRHPRDYIRNGCPIAFNRLAQMYPDGLFIENIRDFLVYVAAHEFKHVAQFQKLFNLKHHRREYAAEKRAIEKLSQWRVETGREPFRRVKLENPFGRNGENK